jgi:hypothetical protein
VSAGVGRSMESLLGHIHTQMYPCVAVVRYSFSINIKK